MVNELKILYPDALPDILQETREEFEREARMALAAKLFEMKRISSGMAATIAGVDRVTFLLSLHRYNVAAIDLSEDELHDDVNNA